jgi:NhaA family Na+:H+ antiporter
MKKDRKALDVFLKLFNEFINSEKTGGFILIVATVTSLILSNSSFGEEYISFWHQGSPDIVHWINDGLMTVFFVLIGLELEREIYVGELSSLKNASLPLFGALGGMLCPAVIYLALNWNNGYGSGFGIPMATDIAFAIGAISLLGNKVPKSLKVFLTAFAVIDDLGAIILIALFYSSTLNWINLLFALVIFGFLLVLNKLKVFNIAVYIIGGIIMWVFMLNSGIHPTITGVMLAFAVPFHNGGEKSPSYIIQHFLHKPVAFLILPLFALANTAIVLTGSFREVFTQPYITGIMLGLILGKPFGIWLFSFLGTKLKLCNLPSDLKWVDILGAGILGGIGFTMSIFITLRAFTSSQVIDHSKLSILISSLFAGIMGFLFLKFVSKRGRASQVNQ